MEYPTLKKNDSKNGLLDAYSMKALMDKFTVQMDNNRAFMVFTSIDAYIDHFTMCKEPMFHEVIFADIPRKFFLDIDFETEVRDINAYTAKLSSYNRHINAIKEIMVAAFNQTYVKYSITIEDILVIESHSNIDDIPNGGKIKLSSNLIIGKYLFPDQIEFVNFGKLILKYYDESGTMSKVIDRGFFTTTTRNFMQNRLVFNTKSSQSRYKYPIIGDRIVNKLPATLMKSYIMQSAIGTGGGKISKIEGVLREETRKRKCLTFKVVDKTIADILAATREHWHPHFTYRDISPEGIISFDRLSASYCESCDRTHDTDNTLTFVIEENGKIFKRCRRNSWYDLVYTISNSEITNTGSDISSNNTNISSNNVSNANTRGFIASKWRHYYPDGLISEVNDTHVSEKAFSINHSINLIISEMKTGKSKSLIKHLSDNTFNKAIFISFRRTFSAEAATKYEELGFKSYSTIEGEIDTDVHKRVIIQVESLFRIKPQSILDNDILILDEIESIWSQFSSNNFKDYNGSFNIFTLLLKRSNRIIAMDANLGDRTVRLLKAIQPDRSVSVYINRYNPNKDYTFTTTDKYSWLYKVRDSLTSGCKVAIFSNSLKSAKNIKTFVSKYTGKVKIYSSKTKESIKRLHFQRVDDYWSQFDCIICTPTVSAGVSFEAKHFDFVFGDFTDRSCNVETCRQMLGRVRDVKSKEIYITISAVNSVDVYPTSVTQLRHNLAINRSDIMKMCNGNYNLQFIPYTIDENTCNSNYVDGFQLNVILENLAFDNRSKNRFYDIMVEQLSGKAMRLSELSEVKYEEAKYEHKAEMKKLYGEISMQTKTKTIEGVLNAKTITAEEYEKIKEKSSNQLDVLSSEHKSVEKFIITQATKLDESLLDAKVVEKFSNKNNIRKLRANRIIFQGSSWEESVRLSLENDVTMLELNNSKAESTITYWGNIHSAVYDIAKIYNMNLTRIGMLDIITGNGKFSVMDPDLEMKAVLHKKVNNLIASLGLPERANKQNTTCDIQEINMNMMTVLRHVYGFCMRQESIVRPMENILYHIVSTDSYYRNGKQCKFIDRKSVV